MGAHVKAILALISALLLTSPARAALLDFGSFSRDTVTGLDWLDTTATAGISYSRVRAGEGGWIEAGWRVATGPEVTDLFTRYMDTPPEDWFGGDAFPRALALVRQIGVNLSFNNTEGLFQLVGPAAGDTTQISIDAVFDDGRDDRWVGVGELIARFATIPAEAARWVVYPNHWPYEEELARLQYGTFLVRPYGANAIAEPPAYLLFVFVALAFVWVRRRAPTFQASPR
jgi:hypothetical protein